MSTPVLSMDVLIPFAVILGLSLAIFYVVHIVEGYEAPTSMAHSLKRTAITLGSVGGGWLLMSLLLNGSQSLDVWEFLIGLGGAALVLLMVDFIVILRRGRTSE